MKSPDISIRIAGEPMRQAAESGQIVLRNERISDGIRRLSELSEPLEKAVIRTMRIYG